MFHCSVNIASIRGDCRACMPTSISTTSAASAGKKERSAAAVQTLPCDPTLWTSPCQPLAAQGTNSTGCWTGRRVVPVAGGEGAGAISQPGRAHLARRVCSAACAGQCAPGRSLAQGAGRDSPCPHGILVYPHSSLAWGPEHDYYVRTKRL